MDDLQPDYNALLSDDPVEPPEPTTPLTDGFEDTSGDLQALKRLGGLASTFRYCGHVFELQTPRGGLELAGDVLLAQYTGTPAEQKASIFAMVAKYLVQADGEYLAPMGGPQDPQSTVTARFSWIASNLYYDTIEAIAQSCLDLKIRADAARRELEGKY